MMGCWFGLVLGVIVMSQGLFFQVNVGISFKFLLGNGSFNQFFQFGLWMCVFNKIESGVLNDVVIFFICFDYENFSFGFSYDINVLFLWEVSNVNGGFEFVLVYKICGIECCGVYCLNF